ncbi:MAG TPA: WhiB family transcriptional regulator [Propionibacteriaceae bacterium]|nr:WhiB family transcriptional regulator [Propionibacteriaceae bacterium]
MSEDWWPAAACRDSDPELFSPIGNGWNAMPQIAAAKAVCAVCPVRAECLAWAFQMRDDHAVLGGTTGPERRAMRRTAASEEATPELVKSS